MAKKTNQPKPAKPRPCFRCPRCGIQWVKDCERPTDGICSFCGSVGEPQNEYAAKVVKKLEMVMLNNLLDDIVRAKDELCAQYHIDDLRYLRIVLPLTNYERIKLSNHFVVARPESTKDGSLEYLAGMAVKYADISEPFRIEIISDESVGGVEYDR